MNVVFEVAIIVSLTLLTTFISLSGGLLLLSGSKLAKFLQKYSLPFAVLVLFYAAFFDIIPEALDYDVFYNWQVALLVLAGFLISAALRFVAAHFHRHDDSHELLSHGQALSMVVVDSLHTLADGLVLGLAFSASLSTGILTAVATAAHEIPQEIGDFSIMLRSGLAKKKILKLEVYSALLILPATLLAFFIGDATQAALPAVLPLIAGQLLYIAISEIWSMIKIVRVKLPSLKEKEL